MKNQHIAGTVDFGDDGKPDSNTLSFRPMRRHKQQLSKEECIRILVEERRGVLSMLGDNGYPYGIPLNHYYSEEDGKIYFHGAMEGHKIDSIVKCDKVSFCVYDHGYTEPGEWALHVKSVIVFGRIKLVTDEAKAHEVCEKLCRKFTDDEEFIEGHITKYLAKTQCLELTIEWMTGKLVKEE